MNLTETILLGGPVIVVLAVLSVLSLTLIAAKIISLRSVLGGKKTRLSAIELWQSGDTAGARAAVAQGNAPADRILHQAMEGLDAGRKKHALDNALEWRGNQEIADMLRHIRLIELIAMVSPLLGLLGTVLGMIQSFQELSLAGGAANAAILAGGIWQALLTTAAGLVVAIPAAIAAGLLNARVERAGTEIESAVGGLFAAEDARHEQSG